MPRDSTPEKKPSFEDQLEMLFPGRRLEIGNGVVAHVYPPGIKHITRFSRDLVGAALSIVGMLGSSKLDAKAKGTQIVTQLLPFVTTNLLELVADCTRLEHPSMEDGKLKLEHVPHHLVPPVISAWIEISFGTGELVRPWKAVIDDVMTRATGKPFSISETLSQLSSQPGTDGKTSSTTASQDSRTTDGASTS